MPQNTIDFPDVLYERIKAAARTDRRVIKAEVVTLVEEALDARAAAARHRRLAEERGQVGAVREHTSAGTVVYHLFGRGWGGLKCGANPPTGSLDWSTANQGTRPRQLDSANRMIDESYELCKGCHDLPEVDGSETPT